MPDPAIETRGLTKLYGSRPAVSDLALEVKPGEVFGFLGQNGAGKTTTIRMLLGLVRPTRGEVRLFGRPLASDRMELLGRVGALVEGPSFYPFLSGEKNLLLIGRATGGATLERVRECLDRVGLLERKDDLYRGYSRGMKQRLGIALAMLHRPELILLDEPTNGLDPPAILRVRKLIRDLAEGAGTTVFVSSHLLHEVELSCDRVAIIEQGKLVAQGEVAELLRPDHDVLELELDDVAAAHAFVRALPFVRRADVEEVAAHGRTRRVAMPGDGAKPSIGALVETGAVAHVRPEGTKLLVVELSLGRAADLNKALVENGRGVRALVPRRRTLEDLFHTRIAELAPASPPKHSDAEEAARRG